MAFLSTRTRQKFSKAYGRARRPGARHRWFGGAVAAAAMATAAVLLACGPGPSRARGQAGVTAPLAAIASPARPDRQTWLNSPPLAAGDLRGKVVLVNFWTYSCINSLRPLPYLRAWAKKYGNEGLVVIGVHAPEFRFEHDVANVRRALADQGVGYPIVLDNDFGIWRAFSNSAWPAFYFIDADGRVRHKVLGEGRYEESERVIQGLLAEARKAPVAAPLQPINGSGWQAPPDWDDQHSPETYVGYSKAEGFGPGALRPDVAVDYRPSARLALNRWSLSGSWHAGGEFTTLAAASGAIAYRFHARDLNLVLAPAADGHPVRFRVRIDGTAPGADHGFDTDAAGVGRVDIPRLYQLVRQSRPVVDRNFEIEFLDPGVRAYVFTFG